MIEARDFVEAARRHGFDWYAGVPCSFLTPFINYVLQDESLHYLSMANEGDAVALVAGVSLGGAQRGVAGRGGPPLRGVTMMQNSGLGNAVSPLTSLTWVFRIPQLLIVTWRGQPGIADEPQHALMGPITPAMLDTMEIPWELFPTEVDAIEPALQRATAYMTREARPYALLMQKGSVAAYPLAEQPLPQARTRAVARIECSGLAARSRPTRGEALREVIARTSLDCVVLTTTGFCGRELYAIDDRPNQLYMVGSMGCVLPLALGLALARPQLRVVVLDGDGAALMRLGAFATAGAYAPANLWHLLLDNGVHDSTGSQATVSPQVSFAGIAAACGYAEALEIDEVARLGPWLNAPMQQGPRFARLLIRPGAPEHLPRPSQAPVEVKTRWLRHLNAAGSA
jgi:phosphonopyruvate decarboxylase